MEMKEVSFDEERSMLETLTTSLADSLPSFEMRADAISDARPYSREGEASRIPGTAEIVLLGKVLWASPWSVWGLTLGAGALLTGGGVQRSGRIIEFWGGFLPLFLKYFPFVAGSPVATFGHVVLGRTWRHLEPCRPHQMIHVGQYERWGLLFVPAYLTWWFVLWCVGKRPYYDNPFEREAYDATSDW